MCTVFCVHVRECRAPGVQKRASDPLGLRLLAVMSCHVSASNEPRSLQVQPLLLTLSHLPSPLRWYLGAPNSDSDVKVSGQSRSSKGEACPLPRANRLHTMSKCVVEKRGRKRSRVLHALCVARARTGCEEQADGRGLCYTTRGYVCDVGASAAAEDHVCVHNPTATRVCVAVHDHVTTKGNGDARGLDSCLNPC